MDIAQKKVFGKLSRISVTALEWVILLGILAMLLLIPILSMQGGFDVRFETAGGSAVADQRLRYGERVEEPQIPVREGYRFCGWYTDPNGERVFDFEGNTVEGSMTVYAKWEAENAE